jgi:hypothetical protein
MFVQRPRWRDRRFCRDDGGYSPPKSGSERTTSLTCDKFGDAQRRQPVNLLVLGLRCAKLRTKSAGA